MLFTLGVLVALALILLLSAREVLMAADLRIGRGGMLAIDGAAILLALVFSYQMYQLIF